MKRINITKETFFEQIDSGFTSRQIAKNLSVSMDTVRRRLKQLNIINPNKTKINYKCKGYTFDKHYFDHVDDQFKAYYLGFIGADGCIEKTWGLKIKIRKRDEEILKRFQALTSFTGPISDDGIDVAIRLYSIDLVKSLSNYGVVRNKTKIYEFAKNIPEPLIHHYLRGIIDGDGSVAKRGYAVKLVTGSESFYQGFLSWYQTRYHMTPWNKCEDGRKWRFNFVLRDRQFVNDLYNDAQIYLARKRDLYLSKPKWRM